MKYYIGVKMIEAKPMTLGEYNTYRCWSIPADEDPTKEGYLITYQYGYQSWSPKEVFELSYLELDDPTKINEADLIRFIGPTAYEVGQLDEKTAVVRMTDRTGFVQYETSSCVDPANFDLQIGADICGKRLKSSLWSLLGFVLQWAKYGLKSLPEAEGVTDAVSPQPVQ